MIFLNWGYHNLHGFTIHILQLWWSAIPCWYLISPTLMPENLRAKICSQRIDAYYGLMVWWRCQQPGGWKGHEIRLIIFSSKVSLLKWQSTSMRLVCSWNTRLETIQRALVLLAWRIMALVWGKPNSSSKLYNLKSGWWHCMTFRLEGRFRSSVMFLALPGNQGTINQSWNNWVSRHSTQSASHYAVRQRSYLTGKKSYALELKKIPKDLFNSCPSEDAAVWSG